MPMFQPALQVPKLIQPPQQAKPAPAPASTDDALTLDALMARQKEIAQSQATMSQQPIASPEQGFSSLAWALVNGLRQRKAERELATGQQEVASAFQTGTDPKTGMLTPEAMAAVARRDPELATKMQIAAMAARQDAAKTGTWEDIPTPQGENGQWQKNSVSGETRKVGGGSPGEGTWKPTDIGGLRDDYTKAAATYDQAAPSFQSMKDAAKTSLGPGDEQGKGAADYNMIVGFAKLLDPNSVVREGEVSSASNLGGYIDTVNGWLQQWKQGGGKLADPVRRMIMQQANSRMQSYYDQVKTKRDWITGIAGRHGVNPDDVVSPLGELSLWADEAQDPNKPPADPNQPAPDTTVGTLPFPGDMPADWPADEGWPSAGQWRTLTQQQQQQIYDRIKEVQNAASPPRVVQ